MHTALVPLNRCRRVGLLSPLLLAPALLPGTLAADTRTALDDYVAKPDSAYTWKVVETVRGADHTTHIVDLTSQQWLTEREVSQPVWRHWLIVTVPDKVDSSVALLLIGGGSSERPAPKAADAQSVKIAQVTRSVVAELKNIPNQPLVFAGDGQKRSEDSLIAYTWDRFLRTGDDRWPARLPMTKAAVRAMDTLTALLASPAGGQRSVDRFVVAGGSKRGWTTWTTAAVDHRVVAIVPVVIDLLNLEPSFIHHYRAYGFYAPAVDDYVSMGIMEWQGTPQYQRLLSIVEPYSYRHRYTMPKLLINATGDQFFLPDSSQFYFDDLPGVKYLRYVPNADHSLKDTDAYETLAAWHEAIIHQRPLPRFRWETTPDQTLRVTAQDPPARVRLWQASNPKARDFRVETLGKVWTSTDLSAVSGSYQARLSPPDTGWTAYLVELTFPMPAGLPLKLTTPVYVVPDTLPFEYHPPTNHLAPTNPLPR